jgi:hypothetical protein
MTPIYARACCLPCGHGNEVAQAVTEPIGIAVGHVDLVFDAIKGDRMVCVASEPSMSS